MISRAPYCGVIRSEEHPTDFAVTRGVRITTMTNIKRFFKDESGATAIEYGLLAALISIAGIAAMKTTGTSLSTKWTSIDTALK